MIFPLSIFVLSLAAIVIMIAVRLSAIRKGQITTIDQSFQFFLPVQQKIDWLAVVIVLACRDGLKYLFLQTLFFFHRLAGWLKIAGHQIEKRFAGIIDMVHGRGAMDKKGAVSFFLREIEEDRAGSSPYKIHLRHK